MAGVKTRYNISISFSIKDMIEQFLSLRIKLFQKDIINKSEDTKKD